MKLTIEDFAVHSGCTVATLYNMIRFLRKVRPDLPRKKNSNWIAHY